MKVLIAEDSKLVRERVVRMVSRMEGIVVSGQTDTVEATIEFIKTENPDAVVLDIQLVDGTAIEVLQSIRHEPRGPLIIILTNYSFPEYREMCLNEGANYFFDKSTEFGQVLDVLGNHVNEQ